MKRRFLLYVLAAVGALCGMAAYHYCSAQEAQTPWDKVSARLKESDQAATRAADEQTQLIQEYFRERRKGARLFATEALSWTGKWNYLKGFLNSGDSHREFLSESFVRNVLNPAELEAQIKQAVSSYLADLQGQENQLLVAIKADLADKDLPALTQAELRDGDEAFKAVFRKTLANVEPALTRDIQIGLGREVAILVATDWATGALVDLASKMAGNMGIVGAAAGGAATKDKGPSMLLTVPLGMAVGWGIEQLVDFTLKRTTSYDPVGRIERQVAETLDNLSASVTDSLRSKLNELGAARSQLRAAALRKLVQGGSR